jgi:hypothetical protein
VYKLNTASRPASSEVIVPRRFFSNVCQGRNFFDPLCRNFFDPPYGSSFRPSPPFMKHQATLHSGDAALP